MALKGTQISCKPSNQHTDNQEYEGESVNRSQMEVKQLQWLLTGFLCVSLGCTTIQLHDSLGSRCICACSEIGFISQNGNRV
jgi:hypothetical protein